MVHGSATCEATTPHLLTHVHTTPATVHEAPCTMPIQQALLAKDRAPGEPLVDAASIRGEFLTTSHVTQGMALRGPTRPHLRWQAQEEGGYRLEPFRVAWDQQLVPCPQGQTSVQW